MTYAGEVGEFVKTEIEKTGVRAYSLGCYYYD
jgi:hypothetical protein